ncbi:hypothetical protein [Erysipelothrix sp. strain 2 (EsS2-6-Brazil)]|uniref:hypothetical protein n=1 Tax=Erysipelothrix sp. strain 2 (EsS2-6-Brazil) TaxID=2500549 RepID=UPI00190966A9|nr:hypothetical protein [Erysipelothrix sp. strain 2 (EsS2-6-Brazil)]MBK2401968.1 hypothetical protein [Erysipelothrix sp. strain 2 (EsS2-6-Brazil)]
MKSFSHTTVEQVSYLLRAPISNFHATVSKGDTETLIMGNPRVSRQGRFNQTRFSVKNITTTMFYPIGTTIDDSQLTQTLVSKDDSNGKIVLSSDNLMSSTTQLFTVPLKHGHLAEGSYDASEQSYFELKTYDGTEDPESVSSMTQKVNRIAKPNVRVIPNNDGKTVNAGDTTTMQFNLGEQSYYDNNANSFGVIDPEFFFIIPENTQIDMSTLKIWASNKTLGSSDYTSEIYTINATGQRALRVQIFGVYSMQDKDSYLPVLTYV